MVLKSGMVPQLGSWGCRTVLLCNRLTTRQVAERSMVFKGHSLSEVDQVRVACGRSLSPDFEAEGPS